MSQLFFFQTKINPLKLSNRSEKVRLSDPVSPRRAVAY